MISGFSSWMCLAGSMLLILLANCAPVSDKSPTDGDATPSDGDLSVDADQDQEGGAETPEGDDSDQEFTNPCDPNPCIAEHQTQCADDGAGGFACSCDINYQDYGEGACKPSNPCAADATCGADHRECANNQGEAVCGECVSGWHWNAGFDACTTDPCDPDPCSAADHRLCQAGTGDCVCDSGYCALARTCVPDGAVSPDQACAVCNSSANANDWSPRATQDECRAAAGSCDLAEFCDGANLDCPTDVFKDVLAPCRDTAGVCDTPEYCSGAVADCPADLRLGGETACRASTNECDAAEVCDGVNNDCPVDEPKPDGTVCNNDDQCVSGTCEDCWNDVGCGDLMNDILECSEPACGIDHVCYHNILAHLGEICQDDGLTCTSDLCDTGGQCNHDTLVAHACLISGTCFNEGEPWDPDGCVVCDPSISTVDWTDDDGAACAVSDDANPCTDEVCLGGHCTHSANDAHSCDDAILCTNTVCHDGACEVAGVNAGCYIDSYYLDGCVPEGTFKGTTGDDSCRECLAAESNIAWTILTGGEACDDGDDQTENDVCDSEGACVGMPVVQGLRIFVTSATYRGNLGGLSGADAKCLADAANPQGAGNGSWKALLWREDWPLAPYTSYYRADGGIAIGTTNEDGYFNFLLNHTISTASAEVWTGMTGEWQYDSSCSDWGDANSSATAICGVANALSSSSIAAYACFCDQNLSLYCVEQPLVEDLPPDPAGTLAFNNVRDNETTIEWQAATDDFTSQEQLQYKLVKAASSSDLDTIEEADAITGDDLLLDWTTDEQTTNVTGLVASTTYWFAVLVKDTSENKALYEPGSTTTSTDGFVNIPAGTFTMGSPEGETGRNSDETQHTVMLTYDFEMKTTEVTQGEFDGLWGDNPSTFQSCGSNCPVEQVTFDMALDYCNALSLQHGLAKCFSCTNSGERSVYCLLKQQYAIPQDCPGFRLPTESEWEYAARAGSTTAFYNGGITNVGCNPLDSILNTIGWYCGNAANTSHSVAGKATNAWGLSDMSGNVWEWVWDFYGAYQAGTTEAPLIDPVGPNSGSQLILRGGSWYNFALQSRSALRYTTSLGSYYNSSGFRPVRSLLPASCDPDTCKGHAASCDDTSGRAVCACNTGYGGSNFSVCTDGYSGYQ